MGESVNGESASSKTISHFTSYPVVSDSISGIKSNPYGAKGISLAENGYSSFIKPTFPYLQGPYSYVSPYVNKADQIGDSVLGKIDEKIPVLKTETKDIKNTAFSYAHYPFDKFGETKKYVFDTYSSEHQKCGDGLMGAGKALVTSSLVLTSDALTFVSNFIITKKEQSKEIAKEKSSN